ncbi:MAG: 50S ribosomal protein L21 [Pacificimonas sp.]
MFAIVRTGGKQYRVAADQKITVDRIPGDVGDKVALDDVLMMGEGDKLKDAAKEVVHAEILEQAKSDKIKVFKKKRRHGYRRTQGHRQHLTVLQITALGGKAPAKKTTAKAEDKPAEEAKAAPKKAAAKKPAAKKAADDKPAAKKKAPAKKAATKKSASAADEK